MWPVIPALAILLGASSPTERPLEVLRVVLREREGFDAL